MAQPLYKVVYERIEARIRQGEYGSGGRLLPEVQLAAELGVSRGTLRRALAALRERGLIDGGPGRGTFVQDPPAATEQSGQAVGVVVPLVAQPHVTELIHGIEGELHRRGYTMLVGNGGSTASQQSDRIRRLLDRGAAALIAYPIDYELDASGFDRLLARDVPIVMVDRYVPAVAVDAVVPDNIGGAYAAVSHLVALGHRRIAFVATDNLTTSSVAERSLGYRQALGAAGLPFDAELVFDSLPVSRTWPASDELAAQTRSRIARFLERTAPTAVFALHDRLAVDVYKAAAVCGLEVPSELSVVGFDDDPVGVAVAPALSTVAQPREAIGRMAAALVADRLEGRRAELARTVLPVRLVLRESTTAPGRTVSDDVEQPAGS